MHRRSGRIGSTKNKKQQIFTEVLSDAKAALDSVKIPFHLHSGTALGAIREGQFIEHDHDIDLGIFADDYKRNLVTAFKKHGFDVKQNGKLKWGKEYTFTHKKYGINVDIFLVYEDIDINGKFYWVASFFGKCNDKKYGFCRWRYRPYDPVLVDINDIRVYSAPISALEDGYGPSWRSPKKFDYFEGLSQGYYTNLIDE
jgi:hypothetical protein